MPNRLEHVSSVLVAHWGPMFQHIILRFKKYVSALTNYFALGFGFQINPLPRVAAVY